MCRAILKALANLLTPWPRTISGLVYVGACGVEEGALPSWSFLLQLFFLTYENEELISPFGPVLGLCLIPPLCK